MICDRTQTQNLYYDWLVFMLHLYYQVCPTIFFCGDVSLFGFLRHGAYKVLNENVSHKVTNQYMFVPVVAVTVVQNITIGFTEKSF